MRFALLVLAVVILACLASVLSGDFGVGSVSLNLTRPLREL